MQFGLRLKGAEIPVFATGEKKLPLEFDWEAPIRRIKPGDYEHPYVVGDVFGVPIKTPSWIAYLCVGFRDGNLFTWLIEGNKEDGYESIHAKDSITSPQNSSSS